MDGADPSLSAAPSPRASPNQNATGASTPLPNTTPGSPGRETHERNAALARGEQRGHQPAYTPCAPDVPGLRPELLFTLLAENVRDYAIFLLDPRGIIRCWDEGARLMKWWTRQQVEGAHLRMMYPDGGSDDGTAEQHLEQSASTGEYTGEGFRIRSDGSSFWAYVTLTALRNAEGALVGFAKVTRDFTARRTVEAALSAQAHAGEDAGLRLEDLKRQKLLMASVSHELRAPLNALLGNIQLLDAGIGGRDRQRAHIEALQRSARHLLQIASDVLDLSRFEAGTLPVAAAVRRLGPAIQDAIADVHGEAAGRGLTLVNAVSGAAADLPYFGDEDRVRQILVNLMMNAIKFTDRGGRVTVSAGTGESVAGAALSGPGPWIYVRVEDTGHGIPPDRLQTIFDPYQKPGVSGGTGLGLSISRELARRMGGDLTVHTEFGAGSSFTLWLPIAPSEPVPR